jgi:predicted dehydrogenase
MKELKVGIVGLGWVAGAHIETLANVQGASVAAVCTRRPLTEADISAQYGIQAKVYHDYAQMVADPEIDMISICTPNMFHPEQTILAAEAGKHLYIEKPLAVTYEQAKAMRDVIRRTGVKACVGFECRFSKQFTMMKALIDQGVLGELHYGEIDYYHGIGPWYGQIEWNVRKDCGGSALLSAGCHALDALLMAMGDEVEEVTSYGSKSRSAHFADYEYDPTSVTIVKFRNGKIGKTAASIDCLQPYYFHVHLVGSKGSLLDNKFYSETIPGTIKEKWSVLETAMVDSGEVTDHPYLPQFQAFIDSIQDDSVMPLTDFDTAFETHKVIYAADLSAAEGRPVRLSELD